MKITSLVSTLFCILIANIAIAQTVLIQGRVLDKKTNKPVVYANIGIEGTYKGGASNFDGFFDFKMNESVEGKTLFVSAVGYETIHLPLTKATVSKELSLKMVPKTLSIDEVDVSAQSLVLYQRLRKAASLVPQNYMNMPYLNKCFYQSTMTENGKIVRERKAAVDVYDETGYRRESKSETFQHLNYAFRQVKKNFEVVKISDGMTQVNDLLEFDIVRNPENILNTEFIRNYDLTLEKETEYEGAKVWVIAYSLPNPSTTLTGDLYATKYDGKIYINQNDFAVVKNETWVKASNYNPQGRSIAAKRGMRRTPNSVDYHFTSIYRKIEGRYILALIRAERNNVYQGKTVNLNSDLLVTELVNENPNPIEGRDFFTDKPYNKSFWSSYNFILE